MKQRKSLLSFFRLKRKPATARAALDSTAFNLRTADYYRDAVNENAARTFDATTRETAQSRGTLEYLNDPLFYGACQKIAALVCGSGAALKIDGPIREYGAGEILELGEKSQYLEKAFRRFADAIDLLAMIRLLQSELLFHGEAFIRKVRSRETLDGFKYVFIRPERILDPPGVGTAPNINDGILYDGDGDDAEPIGYYIQKERVNPITDTIEYELVPDGEIIHVFNKVLPQQRRGIPEIQTALGIIREIKLLRGLEIQAVKNAAKTSVILTTDSEMIVDAAYNGEDNTIQAPAPGSRNEPTPEGVFVAPPGYAPTFGESKHPATGFNEFKKALAADVGAALGVGSGKINNNHADYNFSSAKMDEQHDAVIVAVRQKKIASSFLDVVFNDWIADFSERDRVAAEFLDAAGAPELIGRRWLFPSPRSIDRLKDAQADAVELQNNTITLEEIAARRGLDLEELLIERAREMKQIATIIKESGINEIINSDAAKASTEAIENDENPEN